MNKKTILDNESFCIYMKKLQLTQSMYNRIELRRQEVINVIYDNMILIVDECLRVFNDYGSDKLIIENVFLFKMLCSGSIYSSDDVEISFYDDMMYMRSQDEMRVYYRFKDQYIPSHTLSSPINIKRSHRLCINN